MSDWKLTWGDREWTAEDMTGSHATLIAVGCGNDSYDNLDPRTGTTRLQAILAAFIAHDRITSGDPVNFVDVLDAVSREPFLKLVGAISAVTPADD